MDELYKKLTEAKKRMTDGEHETDKRNRLLSKDSLHVVKQYEADIDRLTTALFKNLTHDDTGRYSDDGGIHFNKIGLERQEILLTACNKLNEAFELLKIL